MRLAVLLALALAACNSADRNPMRASCDEGCPTGEQCVDGTCVKIPPETMLISSPPALGNSAEASFAFAADLDQSTFRCSLDGGEPVACASPFAVAVGEGDHVFEVFAVGADGLIDGTAERWTWRVDLTPPDTTAAGPALTRLATVPLAIAATEAGSRLECSIDGSAWAPCPEGGAVGPLAEGIHAVDVRAVDAAGNPDGSPAQWIGRIDLTPPVLFLDDHPAAVTNSQDANFIFRTDEPEGAKYRCKLDQDEEIDCDAVWEFQELADGPHVVAVHVLDAAGNPSTTKIHEWTIDRSSPNTILDKGPGPVVATASSTFEFHADPTAAWFTCKFDDGGISFQCSSPQTKIFDDGPHTAVITAYSAAGTPDVDPLRISFTVDTKPPTLANLAVAPATSTSNWTKDRTPTYTGTTEGGATVRLYSDTSCSASIGSTVAAADGKFTLEPTNVLPSMSGELALRLRATDAANWSSACTIGPTYHLDSVDPTVTGLAVAPESSSGSPSSDRTPTVTGTTEGSATVSLWKNGTCTGAADASVTTGAGGGFSLTTSDLGAVTQTVSLSVRVSDRATNSSGCLATSSYHLDAEPPTISDLAIAPSTTAAKPSPDRTPTLSGKSEPGATVSLWKNGTCSGTAMASTTVAAGGDFTIDSTDLGEVTQTVSFSVRAKDKAKTDSECVAASSYYLDAQKPTLTVSVDPATAADKPSSDRTPTLTGASEPGATVSLWKNGTCNGSAIASTTVGADGDYWVDSTDLGEVTATVSFSVRARDKAGTDSDCAAAPSYYLDAQPPTVSGLFTTPDTTNAPSREDRPQVRGTTEGLAAVSIYFDAACTQLAGSGTAVQGGAFAVMLDSLGTGEKTFNFHVRATDLAKQSSPCTGTATYRFDRLEPKVVFESGSATVLGSALNVQVTAPGGVPGRGVHYFSSTEPGTVQCELDGKPVDGCQYGATATIPVTPGPHKLSVSVTDAAGNLSSAAGTEVTVTSDAGGHVVLMGHDFQVKPADSVQRMLANAVDLANPIETDEVEILIMEQDATAEERANVRATIIDRLPPEYGRKPVFTSWTAGGMSLGAQLTGKQVLLVLDDANGGLEEYGKANGPALQTWFRQGGVVIVLSGTTMSGDKPVATGTFQFLGGAGLLAVGAPNVLGAGSVTVNSPKDEPVGRDAATPYAVEANTAIGFYAPTGGWGGVQVATWAGAGFAPMQTVVHKYKAAPPLADDFDSLDLWKPQNSSVTATQSFTAGFDGVPSMAFPIDGTPHQLRDDLRLGNSERVLSAWVSLDARGQVWIGFAGAAPEGTTFVQLVENNASVLLSFRETKDWKSSTALTTAVGAPFTVGGWYEVELRVSAAGNPTVRVFDRSHRLVVEQTYNGVVNYAGRSVSLGGWTARVDSLGIFRR